MNIQEAYDALGLHCSASHTDIENTHRAKKEMAVQRLNTAETAIVRQIAMQELQKLHKCKSILLHGVNDGDMEKAEEVTVVSPSPIESLLNSFKRNDISMEMFKSEGGGFPGFARDKLKLNEFNYRDLKSSAKSLPVLVSVSVLFVVGVGIGMSEDTQTEALSNNPLLEKNVQEKRRQAVTQQNKFKDYIVDYKLPQLQKAKAINQLLVEAKNLEDQGALQKAIETYGDVKSGYQDLLGSIRMVVIRKLAVDKAVLAWNNYRKVNNIPRMPQEVQLENLLTRSHARFRSGLMAGASKGYEGVAAKYKQLTDGVQSTRLARKEIEEVRARWYNFRDERKLRGQQVDNVDVVFNEALALENSGQFDDAVQRYNEAGLVYEDAIVNGQDIAAENTWMAKARNRLAEIEAEKNRTASNDTSSFKKAAASAPQPLANLTNTDLKIQETASIDPAALEATPAKFQTSQETAVSE